MKSEKIKKALECCKDLKNPCRNCPYHDRNECIEELNGDMEDYINDLESENKRLLGVAKEKIHDIGEMAYNNVIEAKQLKVRLAELENEKTKLEIELDKRDCVDYPCRLIEKEQLKQFAERLKEKIHERDYVQGYAEIGLCEEIDETLKEFLL